MNINNNVSIYLFTFNLLSDLDLFSIYDITDPNMFQNLSLYNFFPIKLFLDPINENSLYIFSDIGKKTIIEN